MQSRNCKICLIEHDEEIHAATLRLREWLREKVTRNLVEEQEAESASNAA